MTDSAGVVAQQHFVGTQLVELHRLDGEPALVNTDPYGAGWMIKLRVKGDKAGLLSADDYSKQIG